MNRDVLFIFIVFILVISGVYLAFFNKDGLSKDQSFLTLYNLEKQTNINFENITGKVFIWSFENEGVKTGTSPVNGKGFIAKSISNSQTDLVKGYFEDNGFKIDFFDIEQETLSGVSGYKKDKEVCVVKTSILKDENGLPIATDKLNLEVSCGQLDK